MAPTPTPLPLSAPNPLHPPLQAPSAPPTEHPVEVSIHIRDFPDGKSKSPSTLDVAPDSLSIRLHNEIDYRYFTLGGVSISAVESLNASYTRFIKSRIECVRAGDKWGCILRCLWMKLVCSCRWGCRTSSLPAGSVAREPELFDEMPQRE